MKLGATIAHDLNANLRMWHNGHDWVIAFSEIDAASVCNEVTESDSKPGDWTAWADDRSVTLTDDDGAELIRTTKTAAKWVAEHGRGFFASRDW
jgi:hypothetical protein